MSRFATDLMRVVASCYIIFNHVSWPTFMGMGAGEADGLTWLTALGNQFGKPSVLFFIFLSGFAFSGLAGAERLRTGRFYLNRAARIIPPFLVVTVFSFFLAGNFNWIDILRSLPLGTAMFHLYFVPLICYLYLLFPLLRRIRPTPLSLAFLTLGSIVLYGVITLITIDKPDDVLPFLCGGSGSPLCAVLGFESPEVRSAVSTWSRYFLFGLSFFQAGIWLGLPAGKHILEWARRRSRRRLARWLIPAILISYGIVFFDFYTTLRRGDYDADQSGTIWRLSVAVYALTWIFAVALLLRKSHHPMLSWLARCSFLVYLIHPFYIQWFTDWNSIQAVFPVLALSWATAAALQWLALNNKYAGLFLGEGDRLFAPLPGSPRTQSPPSNIP